MGKTRHEAHAPGWTISSRTSSFPERWARARALWASGKGSDRFRAREVAGIAVQSVRRTADAKARDEVESWVEARFPAARPAE